MKKIFAIVLATLISAMSVNAQEQKQQSKIGWMPYFMDFRPHWFVNFQGGIQLPHTPGMGHLISPVFSLNVGRCVVPDLNLRIGIEGCNSKVYDPITNGKQNFKYATGSFDAMLNLASIIRHNRYTPFNFFVLGGVGCNWSGMETNNASHFSPNLRLGAMAELRVLEHLSLNLEYRIDNTNDQFNGRIESGTHDWYSSVLFGMSLVFPDVKKVVVKDRSDEIAALNDQINRLRAENERLRNEKPIVQQVEAPKYITEKIAVLPYVFFDQAKTTINRQQTANVKAIADYLKSNKETKVTITGYASPEGNAELNQKLSAERAKAVAEMLVKKYGIAEDRISTAAGGATSDILPEADLNRVCVSVAK